MDNQEKEMTPAEPSENWKWLEEIEHFSKHAEDQWDDLSLARQVPRLIACIKVMREALTFYANHEHRSVPGCVKEEDGFYARHALTRCAEGKFE